MASKKEKFELWDAQSCSTVSQSMGWEHWLYNTQEKMPVAPIF